MADNHMLLFEGTPLQIGCSGLPQERMDRLAGLVAKAKDHWGCAPQKIKHRAWVLECDYCLERGLPPPPIEAVDNLEKRKELVRCVASVLSRGRH